MEQTRRSRVGAVMRVQGRTTSDPLAISDEERVCLQKFPIRAAVRVFHGGQVQSSSTAKFINAPKRNGAFVKRPEGNFRPQRAHPWQGVAGPFQHHSLGTLDVQLEEIDLPDKPMFAAESIQKPHRSLDSLTDGEIV